MCNWQRGWMMAGVVLGLTGRAAAWEIPLSLQEYWGQGGLRREYWQQISGVRWVSGGVPLLPGQAQDPATLRVVAKDVDGTVTVLPAQFRVLARWWRADNSIRWVLVDFGIEVPVTETRQFFLTTGADAAPAPKQPAVATVTDDAVTVTTGPARFVLSRKRFAFLDHAYIDESGDGQFTPDEDFLATTADHGTVLEDTFGEKYYASEGTKSVEVLEAGPVRVQVRARGMHRAREGKGYRHGLYSYDYIVNFYAGSTDVFVDVIIGNNPPKSTGSPTFEDASLVMKLAGGATGYRLYGAAPLDGTLEAGQSLCLYQDSNGAETWQRAMGHYGPKSVSFRGYRILKRTAGAEEVLLQGDRARGLAHLFNDRGGIIVHTRDFWQQFPKAVEVSADGTVRVGLFPRECSAVHFLEDASAKGHEIALHFYSLKRDPLYPSDGAKRPWPHYIADCYDYPIRPRPPLDHIAAAGALNDLGPCSVPTHGFYDYALEVMERKLLTTERYWGNGYGWQMYGSRWYAHGGHSSRGARQPIRDDFYLYRWFHTGGRGWLVAGDARSRHFRDVRCYRIEDQDPFGFRSWDAFRKANRSEDYCNRPQPEDNEIKKYSQGLWKRSTWWLPNPAHMTLDLIYDRYLLTGDVRSFENMRIVAGHGGNFAAYAKPFIHRQTGWSWRTLERYWELTGDKAAEQCLMDTLKNYEGLIGKEMDLPKQTNGEVNWWFTQVWSRAVAMTALHTGDRRALDLCKTLAKQVPPKQGKYLCTLFAVLYHLTGDQSYRDIALGKDEGRSLLEVTTWGDFPPASHWLLHQPPRP